jgi:hypothetical protein
MINRQRRTLQDERYKICRIRKTYCIHSKNVSHDCGRQTSVVCLEPIPQPAGDPATRAALARTDGADLFNGGRRCSVREEERHREETRSLARLRRRRRVWLLGATAHGQAGASLAVDEKIEGRARRLHVDKRTGRLVPPREMPATFEEMLNTASVETFVFGAPRSRVPFEQRVPFDPGRYRVPPRR